MSRTVTLTLTVPQAEALWSAARYKLDFPEDTGEGLNAERALRNAFTKLDTAIDTVRDNGKGGGR